MCSTDFHLQKSNVVLCNWLRDNATVIGIWTDRIQENLYDGLF